MVGLFKALPLLLFATLAAAADFAITSPSSSIWWVAKSTNVMAWNCNDSPSNNFTVLINNTNQAVLPGNLAFIAIQDNTACSVIVSQSEVSQPAAAGYTLIFANPFNSTDVYAASELFEIKPLGSLYPSQVTSSGSIASGTGSAASPSGTTTSGAFGMHIPTFIEVAGIMVLLAALSA